VVEWRVAEGEMIEEDQPVVDVMTDKALVEITAPEAGMVSRLHVAQGEIARVHAPLYAYRPEGEAEAAEEAPRPRQEASASPAEARRAAPTAAPRPVSDGGEPGRGPYGRIPAAPAVRRLLREHGLALDEVAGSGKQGRVLKEDVLRHLEHGDEAASSAAWTETASQSPTPQPAEQEVRVEPLRGVRAVMAKRMVESATTIPHFQYGEEIDVTELLALRERLKPLAAAEETRLTLMPFFMKAMALAVREAPILNARLNDAASEIHYLPRSTWAWRWTARRAAGAQRQGRGAAEPARRGGRGPASHRVRPCRQGEPGRPQGRDHQHLQYRCHGRHLCRTDHQCPGGGDRGHRQDPDGCRVSMPRTGWSSERS
jgi:2-oxoisovalerate dehydrogenase E2 component (dihydrolipoyl transacylase)